MTIFIPEAASVGDLLYASRPRELSDPSSLLEHIAFNSTYPQRLKHHIRIALFESNVPIDKDTLSLFFGVDSSEILADLVKSGVERDETASTFSYIFPKRRGPHVFLLQDIDIRGSEISIDFLDTTISSTPQSPSKPSVSSSPSKSNRIATDKPRNFVTTISLDQVLLRAYPGAVLAHHPFEGQDKTADTKYYIVERVDVAGKRGYMRPVFAADPVLSESRIPKILSSTTLLESSLFKTREKVYSVGEGVPGAFLYVKFSWSRVSESTVGYGVRSEILEPLSPVAPHAGEVSSTVGDFIEGLLATEKEADREPKYTFARIAQPPTRTFEAPALELQFSPEAVDYIRRSISQVYAEYSAKVGGQQKLEAKEFERHISYLKESSPYLCMHTFIHQIMSACELVAISNSMTSSGDVQETAVGDNLGYIVDSAAGGNGACEILFDRFDDVIKLTEEAAASGACPSCFKTDRSDWGCSACLYDTGRRCRSHSRGLMVACGTPLLRLKPMGSLESQDPDSATNSGSSSSSQSSFLSALAQPLTQVHSFVEYLASYFIGSK